MCTLYNIFIHINLLYHSYIVSWYILLYFCALLPELWHDQWISLTCTRLWEKESPSVYWNSIWMAPEMVAKRRSAAITRAVATPEFWWDGSTARSPQWPHPSGVQPGLKVELAQPTNSSPLKARCRTRFACGPASPISKPRHTESARFQLSHRAKDLPCTQRVAELWKKTRTKQLMEISSSWKRYIGQQAEGITLIQLITSPRKSKPPHGKSW